MAVSVAVTILFGIFALYSLPIQLFPDIEKPQIGIRTDWRAASPREVESQIVQPEEEVLQGIPGLSQMDAYANPGGGYVNLTFALGTDIRQTLIDIIGRLNRIPSLPPDSERPFVQLANTQDSNATLLWVFMQEVPGNKRDVDSYEPFIRYTVIPRLESIPGVGSVEFNLLAAQEIQIVFDPMRAAALGIQIPKMAGQISNSDDVSGNDRCRATSIRALVSRALFGCRPEGSHSRVARRKAGSSRRYR
jgi:multidrug efflux pump subunit AcrB